MHKQENIKGTKYTGITLPPAEGKSIWVLGDLVTFKAVSEDTRGMYALFEIAAQPQNELPPHTHLREDEAFYVLEGEFSFLHGDRTIHATEGSFVYIPKGILHTYKNLRSTTGRLLVVVTPAGLERFFEEIGETPMYKSYPPLIDPPDMEKLRAVTQRYHIEIKIPEIEG